MDIYNNFEEFEQENDLKPTYGIVSKFAYLIGVSKSIFDNEHEPPKAEYFTEMDHDRNAKIIRHLCIIRTSIERGYKKINDAMQLDNRTYSAISENVPAESLNYLTSEGIQIYKPGCRYLSQTIITINRLIGDKINNCRNYFPTEINWEYIRQLFNFKDCLSEEGVKAAAELYYANMVNLPYQVFMNWPGICDSHGNVLFCDKKFIALLYRFHGDRFVDSSMVSDVGDNVKEKIYDYLNECQKVEILVDCENSDPFNLCAALDNLDEEATGKIGSIVLFNDIHASSGWDILDEHTVIPVETVQVDRIKEDKSLVDLKLIGRANRDFYKNGFDSFVIVSSDSDFWAMVEDLTKDEARFMFMVEHRKCGRDIRNELVRNGIFYCYIDDFYSGDSTDLKTRILLRDIRNEITSKLDFTLDGLLQSALDTARVTMDDAERKQFSAAHLNNISITFDAKGYPVFSFDR